MEKEEKKSLFVAYLALFCGGIFGLHQFYLRNDQRAFLNMISFSGFFCALFWDFFELPSLVAISNNEEYHTDLTKLKKKHFKRPPFSLAFIVSLLFFSSYFARLASLLNFLPFLSLLPPLLSSSLFLILESFFSSLGVYLVSTCGERTTSFKKTFILSSLSYLFLSLFFSSFLLHYLMVVLTPLFSLSFLSWAPKRDSSSLFSFQSSSTSFFSRFLRFALLFFISFAILYALFFSGADIEFNYQFFEEMASEIKEKASKYRTNQAFSTLGLKPGASVSQINSAFRKLSLQHHPDHGGKSENFQDIVSARDLLLSIHKGKTEL